MLSTKSVSPKKETRVAAFKDAQKTMQQLMQEVQLFIKSASRILKPFHAHDGEEYPLKNSSSKNNNAENARSTAAPLVASSIDDNTTLLSAVKRLRDALQNGAENMRSFCRAACAPCDVGTMAEELATQLVEVLQHAKAQATIADTCIEAMELLARHSMEFSALFACQRVVDGVCKLIFEGRVVTCSDTPVPVKLRIFSLMRRLFLCANGRNGQRDAVLNFDVFRFCALILRDVQPLNDCLLLDECLSVVTFYFYYAHFVADAGSTLEYAVASFADAAALFKFLIGSLNDDTHRNTFFLPTFAALACNSPVSVKFFTLNNIQMCLRLYRSIVARSRAADAYTVALEDKLSGVLLLLFLWRDSSAAVRAAIDALREEIEALIGDVVEAATYDFELFACVLRLVQFAQQQQQSSDTSPLFLRLLLSARFGEALERAIADGFGLGPVLCLRFIAAASTKNAFTPFLARNGASVVKAALRFALSAEGLRACGIRTFFLAEGGACETAFDFLSKVPFDGHAPLSDDALNDVEVFLSKIAAADAKRLTFVDCALFNYFALLVTQHPVFRAAFEASPAKRQVLRRLAASPACVTAVCRIAQHADRPAFWIGAAWRNVLFFAQQDARWFGAFCRFHAEDPLAAEVRTVRLKLQSSQQRFWEMHAENARLNEQLSLLGDAFAAAEDARKTIAILQCQLQTSADARHSAVAETGQLRAALEAARSDCQRLRQQTAASEASAAEARESLHTATAQLGELRAEATQTAESLRHANTLLDAAHQRLDLAEKQQIPALHAKLTATAEERDAAAEASAALHAACRSIAASIAQTTGVGECDAAADAQQLLATAVSGVLEAWRSLRLENDSLHENVANLSQTLHDAQCECKALAAAHSHAQTDAERWRTLHDTLQKENASLKAKMQRITQCVAEIDA